MAHKVRRVVGLSGTGVGRRTIDRTLSVAPASLTFASRRPRTTSGARTVIVKNTGTGAVTVTGITITGDFAWTSTCGTSIVAGASCEVSVRFAPVASGTRSGRLIISSNASSSPATVTLSGNGTRARSAKVNLALGKPTSASGYTQNYVPSNAVDGNTSTYWESTDNAFPQWLQVDLGATKSFSRIVIDLPPLTIWPTRTQTLSVLGSNNGSTFTTIVKSAGYTFNPATGNTVTITFRAARARYVRLYFTANTGWPAGQASEFQVWTR